MGRHLQQAFAFLLLTHSPVVLSTSLPVALLQEWEQEQKLKRQRELQKLDPDASGNESDSEDDDGLPFACFICRRPWAEIKDPVVTRCKHYFCESCALKHNAKTSKCFVCEQPTGGIFNVATEIEKKVKLQKQQDISNR